MDKPVKVHLRTNFKDHWVEWWEKHQDRVPEDMRESVYEGEQSHGYEECACVPGQYVNMAGDRIGRHIIGFSNLPAPYPPPPASPVRPSP